jgi:hypothetical protein
MQLLGDWNWWLPPFLRWLPHIAIEGGPEMTEPEETTELPEEVLEDNEAPADAGALATDGARETDAPA